MTNLPIFQQALGEEFDRLHPALAMHYGSAGDLERTSSGTMAEIKLSRIANIISPLMRLLNALVPYEGINVPTTLVNSQPASCMRWIRTFSFPNKAPYVFATEMVYAGDHKVIEYVRYGLGVELKVREHQGKLLFISTRYVWRLGSLMIPIPSFLGPGNATILEEGIGDNKYVVDFEITHPLFGFMFGYNGTFEIK